VLSDSVSDAILDSGTSLITIPYNDFLSFSSKLKSKHNDVVCEMGSISACYFERSCAHYFDSLDYIKVQLGDNYVYGVSPRDYLVDIEH
jgi:hypothetical protein